MTNCSHRAGALILLAASTNACAGRHQDFQPTVIVNTPVRGDPLQPQVGMAGLLILTRSADQPERALEGVAIEISQTPLPPPRFDPKSPRTRPDGSLRFDNLKPGAYWLRALRIGFTPATLGLDLRANCPSRIELYLAERANCQFGCPENSPRAVFTKCP